MTSDVAYDYIRFTKHHNVLGYKMDPAEDVGGTGEHKSWWYYCKTSESSIARGQVHVLWMNPAS
jgi:hypothetical protein